MKKSRLLEDVLYNIVMNYILYIKIYKKIMRETFSRKVEIGPERGFSFASIIVDHGLSAMDV